MVRDYPNYPVLEMYAGENRVFDVQVLETLRAGSTLDAMFTPVAAVDPSGVLVVTNGAAVTDGAIIRGLYTAPSSAAGRVFTVSWTFRTSIEQARIVRVIVRVE